MRADPSMDVRACFVLAQLPLEEKSINHKDTKYHEGVDLAGLPLRVLMAYTLIDIL